LGRESELDMTEVIARSAWPVPIEDPYPTLAELRSQSHAHYLSCLDCYLVVAHSEANTVLSGQGWSADPRNSRAMAGRFGMLAGGGDLLAKSVLFSDPPAHQCLRRALGTHLAPKAVERFRPRIRSIVGAAFSGLEESESFDVMDRVAYPVPLAAICELLDVGVHTAQVLRSETPKMTAMLDPLAGTEELDEGAGAAFGAMLELVPLVAERRSDPRDNLLSALVSTMYGHRALESDEAVMMALLLLAAGHETTANLIGNAVLCLNSYPDHARWLRRHPEHIGQAIEELLRFESPVQLTSRVAKSVRSLDGVEIEAGAQVLVSLGAANRDPAAFVGPDSIDLKRVGSGHLAFGHGPHFCAGAALARCETEEVLRRVLNLEPHLEEREVVPQRGSSITFRRMKSLAIRS
jgi:cytochrome P450